MALTASIGNFGDKLIVGAVDTSFLTASSRVLPGTAVLNGPVFIGATPQIGIARAACMIGPPLPGLSAPASLEVTGITNIIGSLNVFAVSFFTGVTTKQGVTIKNALSLKNSICLKNSISVGNAPKINNAPLIVHSFGIFDGTVGARDFLADGAGLIETNGIAKSALSIANTKKNFDIKHPSKEGHRLRYVCLEGPTADVFLRGRLKNESTIVLPEYWKHLVDPKTISVNLTPIGSYQELFVEEIQWGSNIKVKNNLEGLIDCHYVVYGERADVEKNITEYQGLTPYDYPGDNSQCNINGF
jgi:hypothetical protein